MHLDDPNANIDMTNTNNVEMTGDWSINIHNIFNKKVK